MSLLEADNRVPYVGNGSTTDFDFPFQISDETELVVLLIDTDTGVISPQTLTTHYTVDEGDENGGTVTMVTAPASTEELVIYADPPIEQNLDLGPNDNLPVESVESQLDYVQMVARRNKDLNERSIRLSDGDTSNFDPTLPIDLGDAVTQVPVFSEGAILPVADWPTTADIINAEENADAAADSATAAAASATASAASAAAAAVSDASAGSSASAAAASAAAAAATFASVMWQDVSYKVFADSPVTLTDADSGKLFVFDCTGGNIAVTLPAIAGLTLTNPWVVGLKKTDSGTNTVTATRASTDTIDGATTKVLSKQLQGCALVPDTDAAPDDWTVIDFGPQVTDVTAASALGVDNVLVRADGTGRGVQASGISVSDGDAVTGVTALTVDNIFLDANEIAATGNLDLTPSGANLLRTAKNTTINATLAIGQATAAATSAILELVSTSKALLLTRMTTAQRGGITPVAGMMIYNSSLSKFQTYDGTWRSIGAGGGGGSLRWVPTGNSPVETQENNLETYMFESGQAQQMYCAIKVPATYATGTRMYLYIPYYSPDTSGTALLTTVTTLIQDGAATAVTSTTNQRTSANAAVDLAGTGIADSYRYALCDLMDSSGQINAVSVAAGDLLIVSVTRGTDTSTSDIRALLDSSEIVI